jgi:predicted nucleic acid-binding protein
LRHVSVTLFVSGVVLDNTVISSFHTAGALSDVLRLRGGLWIVPFQVREEAGDWPGEGMRVVLLLDSLEASGVISFASPEPGVEGALFAQLRRTRGKGESAAIAIAHSRNFVVATDDRRAIGSCQSLNPAVSTIRTEGILRAAVNDRLMTLGEARRIWQAMGIQDPNRGIGP